MTKEQERVKKAIEYLIHYMDTYPLQYGYQDYSDEIIIDDVLYGLGVALNGEEFQYAQGFQKFKQYLLAHIMKTTPIPVELSHEKDSTDGSKENIPEKIEMCTCGKNPATTPHPCPFMQDVHNDSEDMCTCCDECARDCAADV